MNSSRIEGDTVRTLMSLHRRTLFEVEDFRFVMRGFLTLFNLGEFLRGLGDFLRVVGDFRRVAAVIGIFIIE